jgi:hypothetical protein
MNLIAYGHLFCMKCDSANFLRIVINRLALPNMMMKACCKPGTRGVVGHRPYLQSEVGSSENGGGRSSGHRFVDALERSDGGMCGFGLSGVMAVLSGVTTPDLSEANLKKVVEEFRRFGEYGRHLVSLLSFRY